MNNLLKVLFVIIIIFFLSLYFSKYNNEYFESKNTLTEEAIKKYENDLKNGEKINPNNYRIEEKNYNNKASILGIKASRLIESTFRKGMKYIVKYLENG